MSLKLYEKFRDIWKDKPNKTTPVTAEAMMHIEQGIFDNSINSQELLWEIQELNGLKSEVDEVKNIASGLSNAKVFDTKEELDEWLSVSGNSETLKVGQNIYIVEKDTPDYWWDGNELQELETDKVIIEELSYDETMEILNGSEVA